MSTLMVSREATGLATMAAIESQNCPLCSNPAEFTFVDHRNRKHFFCRVCTEFQVSTAMEFRLEKAPKEWRSGLSQLAKQHPPGKTLVIVRPDNLGAALKDEYVLNSELPRGGA